MLDRQSKILGIIPARYGSTRLPGKPLLMIDGKTMIQRVYEQAKKSSLTDVVVATDDETIFHHVYTFGKVYSTRESHKSGTDRCYEAFLRHIFRNSFEPPDKYDYVINIQGDMPFIHPEQIDQLAELCNGETEIATLATTLKDNDIRNRNVVKVYIGNGYALDFRRIGLGRSESKHIGIYAYRSDILKKITSLPESQNEKSESLEQLRWIENGYNIKVAITEHDSPSIDTPEDYGTICRNMRN